jgi:multisubunit Na+/H+ antiporter MnhB subunit
MFNRKKFALLVLATTMQLIAISQTNDKLSSPDDGLMRSEGKIYVVMAVAVTVFVGLLLYIMRLDRKITRLEKGESG